MASKAGVSVIICCHNSAPRLPETLKHLAKQRLPPSTPWEVILVNNASTDNTAAVASQRWSAEGAPASMRIVDEPTLGLSHARARGIVNACYDTVVFVDDDNWLASDYLSVASEIMGENPAIGALGGTIDAEFEEEPPRWFFQLQSQYAVGPQSQVSGDITMSKCHLAGAGMVLRKSADDALKSSEFKFLLSDRRGTEMTSGGDTELCFGLALCDYRIWYDDRLKVKHFIPAVRLTKNYAWRLRRGILEDGLVALVYWANHFHPQERPTCVFFRHCLQRFVWCCQAGLNLIRRKVSWFVFGVQLRAWLLFTMRFRKFLRLYRSITPRLRGMVAARQARNLL